MSDTPNLCTPEGAKHKGVVQRKGGGGGGGGSQRLCKGKGLSPVKDN